MLCLPQFWRGPTFAIHAQHHKLLQGFKAALEPTGSRDCLKRISEIAFGYVDTFCLTVHFLTKRALRPTAGKRHNSAGSQDRVNGLTALCPATKEARNTLPVETYMTEDLRSPPSKQPPAGAPLSTRTSGALERAEACWAEMDRQETKLQAFVDRESPGSVTPAGPLYGLPYAAKDLFDMAGRAPTWGLRKPPGGRAVPRRTAIVLQRLEAAGSVRLGYTRMTPQRASRHAGQSARSRLRNRRLVIRVGSGCGSGHGRCGPRHGHGRLAAHPGILLWGRRLETDLRRRSSGGCDAPGAQPRQHWPVGTARSRA